MPEVVFQEANISSKQSWETKLGRGLVVLPQTSLCPLHKPSSAPPATAQLIHMDDAPSVWSQLLASWSYSDCCRVPCSKIDQALLSIRPRCGDRWMPTSNLHAQSPHKGSGDVFNITHLPQASFQSPSSGGSGFLSGKRLKHFVNLDIWPLS